MNPPACPETVSSVIWVLSRLWAEFSESHVSVTSSTWWSVPSEVEPRKAAGNVRSRLMDERCVTRGTIDGCVLTLAGPVNWTGHVNRHLYCPET